MKTLALGVEAAFVEWTTSAIDEVLAAEVAGEFPGHGGGIAGGKRVAQYPTGVFVSVGADFEVFIQAHGVDDDG